MVSEGSLSAGLPDSVLAPAIAAATTLIILILALIVLALYRSQIKIWMFSRYTIYHMFIFEVFVYIICIPESFSTNIEY